MTEKTLIHLQSLSFSNNISAAEAFLLHSVHVFDKEAGSPGTFFSDEL